ncbi:MAG: DUF423 domain-containing protein [Gammaproteobacteria bacterium]|nr:DUF423 domain-containing protein [Gammaproteobacteria bacterium]MCY4199300.1 DUF423 domain-containing protein [Gammaproteobacteria bacterium]
MSPQAILIWGASLTGVGVLLGAFGAHSLRSRLTSEALEWFQTGLNYHFIHSLSLLALALILIWLRTMTVPSSSGFLPQAAIAFIVGIVLFSGSLYLMALGAPRMLGMVTPLGGLAFLAGWALVVISIARS